MPRELPMNEMKLALFGSTGALVMSVFHQLSVGEAAASAPAMLRCEPAVQSAG